MGVAEAELRQVPVAPDPGHAVVRRGRRGVHPPRRLVVVERLVENAEPAIGLGNSQLARRRWPDPQVLQCRS